MVSFEDERGDWRQQIDSATFSRTFPFFQKTSMSSPVSLDSSAAHAMILRANLTSPSLLCLAANRRDVLTLNWSPTQTTTVPVAMVAIGAMLVGSIAWAKANQGDSVKRGDEA